MRPASGCRFRDVGGCLFVESGQDWDNRHGNGIYNEYCANDALLIGNYFLHWWTDPVQRFPEEEKTLTTVAETVPRGEERRGSVYRMEWSAPLDRRAVPIQSIEFVGGGKGMPVLLGITGVMEW